MRTNSDNFDPINDNDLHQHRANVGETGENTHEWEITDESRSPVGRTGRLSTTLAEDEDFWQQLLTDSLIHDNDTTTNSP